jgi:regulator of protease activity HflC (stomatin/prohibitin superfamily)
MTPGEAAETIIEADPGAVDLTLLAAFADAGGAMRTLFQVAAVQFVALLLLLSAAFATWHWPGRSLVLDALVHEGAAGLTGAALLISLTGTLACLLIVLGRQRTLDPAPAVRRRIRILNFTSRAGRLPPVTRAAGWPQAILILAGMGAAAWMLRGFPPLPPGSTAAVPGRSGLAGLMLLPAFLFLVCERVIAACPPNRLPEAARLAALLRIPAFTLLLLAGLSGAAGFGFSAGRWPAELIGGLLMALAGELALRAVGVWFLPLAAPEAARAAINSLLASLLQPGTLRPAALAQRMRAHLGIDITRSWAATYVRAAAPPVLLGLLVLAWGLTGVTRIGVAERGAYERFGAPAAVLRPGLHLLLPWPFGRVLRTEYGVVHAVSVGAAPDGAVPVIDASTADGPPPPSANRLWDVQPRSDNAYLIASRGAGKESFETVSADIRVLYRIGLDDESARRALYGLVAPDELVRALSDRLLAGFFANRTLDDVLGARREQVAAELRGALQTELDKRRSGVEVVAVVVESMRPPGGAAAAYRSVQAAQIVASTQRAQETGRAYGSLSVAARDAHDMNDQAEALAAELTGSAGADSSRADADTLAYRDGGRAFLLERYFSNLAAALNRAALEIVDNRLGRTDAPMIDLRAAGEPSNTTPSPQTDSQWAAPNYVGR